MSHSSSHSSANLDPAHLDHTYLDPGHLGHGPDCCCGDLAVSDRYAVTHAEAPVQDCCYVSSELTLKQGDPQSEPFMLAPKPSNQELPEAALVLILAALWPDELFAQQPAGARHLYADRSAPGTKTYLSTQRLRI